MTRREIKKLQRALVKKGYSIGTIDGILGPRTERAVVAFKKSVGLRARPRVGPLTRAALLDERPGLETKTYLGKMNEPAWLRVARSYLGLREYRGNRHNPKIVEWWIKLGLPFRNDETPWCAGYVCGVLEEVSIRSPRSAAARSFHWKNWGTVLNEPAVGAVVSMWRGSKRGAYGHVGFVVGRDRFDHLMVIGGNQGNCVSIKPFECARVLSYHWPREANPPTEVGFNKLPMVKSSGRVSKNEA